MTRSYEALQKSDTGRKAAASGAGAEPVTDAQPITDAQPVADAQPVTDAQPKQATRPKQEGTQPVAASAARPVPAPAPAQRETRGALVAVPTRNAGGGIRRRWTGWVERFASAGERRGESQLALQRRIEALEKKLAAAEERFGKQLAGSEERSLQLVEERVQSAHQELMEAQRTVAQRLVARETRPLRSRLHLATFLSLAAGGASAYVLLVMLGLLPR
jgi:hypothetical protein